jgi:hypothetical protein
MAHCASPSEKDLNLILYVSIILNEGGRPSAERGLWRDMAATRTNQRNCALNNYKYTLFRLVMQTRAAWHGKTSKRSGIKLSASPAIFRILLLHLV